VQGETGNRPFADVDLAGVHAGGERKLELFCGVQQRKRATNGTRGSVEMGPDLVAPGSDQATGLTRNGVGRCFAQSVDALIPKAVAEPGGKPLRRYQPRHQKGGENAIMIHGGSLAGQELLDLVGDAIHVAGPDRMVAPGKLDEPCAADLSREIAPARDCDPRVIASMQDQRRDANIGKHIADVDLRAHAGERDCGRRADR
jgi:hypothetical protein